MESHSIMGRESTVERGKQSETHGHPTLKELTHKAIIEQLTSHRDKKKKSQYRVTRVNLCLTINGLKRHL